MCVGGWRGGVGVWGCGRGEQITVSIAQIQQMLCSIAGRTTHIEIHVLVYSAPTNPNLLPTPMYSYHQ